MHEDQDTRLDESENRYRTLLGSVSEAIISTDLGGQIDFMNPGAERLTGWTESEALKMQSDEVFRLVNWDTLEPMGNPVQRVLHEGKSFEFTDYSMLIARNGSQYSITGTGSPVRNAKGELTNSVLIFRERVAEPATAAKSSGDGAYRSLFENMLNGLAHCKMLFENDRPVDFVYLDVNSAFELQTGLKNVVGRRASEVIPGIQQLDPDLIETYGRVALTGKPERFETYVEALKMWFSISVYSPANEHFIAVFDVITERKQAESELRESETRYRTLAESLPHLVWTCRGDGPCDYLSPRWVDYTGIPEKDQLGYGWLEQLHPDDRERVVAEWTEVAPLGDIFDIEFRIRRADGQYRWFKTRAIPFRDNDGHVVKWFGSNTDIDDNKRAHEALRLSEERQRATLRSIGDGVVSTDASSVVTQLNPVAEALIGWTEAEAIGTPVADVFRIVNEDTRSDVENPVTRVLREGQIVGLANHTLLIAKDGSEHPIADSGAPILDSAGNVTGVVFVFRDQTEERRAQRALEQSEAKYRSLFDNAQVGMYRSRLDGSGYLAVNPRLAEFVGFTSEEMLANSAKIPWADPSAREEMVRLVRERGELIDYEADIVTKSGEIRTAVLSIKLYADEGYLEGTAIDVTERKRAEKEIEHLAKFPLENPHPILRVRNDGNVMFANPSSEALLDVWGCSVGEFLPSNLRDLVTQSIATKTTTPVEVSYNNRVLSVLIVPIPGTDYVNLYGRDITERERVQEALRKSEARLSFALNTINTGAWELDLRDHTANRTLTHDQIFGYESLLPSWTFEIFLGHVLPEDRADVDRRFREATATQSDWSFECRIRRIDGEVRWIRAVGRHELNADSTPVRLAGVVQDITESKRAQDELQASEIKYRELHESIRDAFIEVSLEGRVIDFNREFTNMLGYSADELRKLNYQDLTPDKWHAHSVEVNQQLMTQGYSEVHEKEYRRKDGSVFPVEIRAFLLRDASGTPRASWGIARDITSRKATEATLKKATEDLARSNKELEQFAYVASHDLQEPLRMVASYTQLLAQRYENQLDDKAKMYIDYAVGGALRMQQLIQDLLTYSRLNTQAKPLELTDVNQVLFDVFRNLQVAIDESGASVATDDLPTVRADASQLVHVFQNLIANGIKFRRADPPRIHVSAIEDGQYWRFSVQDNGIGIEPQYSDRIFVIFQRLHTRQEYPGTGIGLTVCKRIVVRHGGKIWFESEPGKGTTFFFTIPK